MDCIGTILTVVAVLIFFFFQALTWNGRTINKRLPPGPRGVPIIGNLLMIGTKPHRDLQQLARKYGPIMHLRFGVTPVIVVSSPEAAELFLKTHDLVFASRPPLEASRIISYNQQNLATAPYGSYWRNMRKMCTLELLSNHKINSFMSMRKEEISLLVRYIKGAASARLVLDLTSKVSSFSTDVSCRLIIGKKYNRGDFGEKGFDDTIREAMHIAATFNLGDYIPQIKGLDLQGLTKRMKIVANDFDLFLEKIIDEHVQSKDENRIKDFVDVMLGFMGSEETHHGYRVERDNIKAIILDMLIASMDTSATAIDWILSELIRHPNVTIKVQKELENVVGMERMVDESDLEKLEYLDMVVKESFRLHPVAPLLLHASREDCTVNGFHIPKDSRILINTWAIGRDQRVWNDAEKFYPERFIGSDIDLRGQNFELIPFGSGRRGCPGMQLGLTVVRLVVAQLVHCFDWELPNDMLANELDMIEDFGIVSPRAKHLLAIPTWRLRT